jgi:O-antigen ligase
MFKNKEMINFYPVTRSQKMLWLFVFTAIVSVVFNPIENRLTSIFRLKYFIIILLCIPLFEKYKKEIFTPKLNRTYLNILCITTMIATTSGIIAVWSGFHYLRNKPACHLDRACGMYGMYMSYGYGIQFVVVLLAGICIYYKKFKDYINLKILLPALAINFIGLYMSFTRGAMVGFLVSLPFLFFRKNTKKFLISLIVCLSVAVPVIYFVPKLNDAFLHRPGSTDQRKSHFQAAIAGFGESPIYGLGYKNFESQSRRIKYQYNLRHADQSGHAHNNFLEAMASTGLLGVIFFTLFIAFWFRESWLMPDGFSDISISIVVAFFVSGMVQYTFGDGENLFVILFFYLLSQIFRDNSRKQI